MMWSWVSGLFSAIGSLFGYFTRRAELKNAPEMKRADRAQKDATEADRVHDEVKRGDLDSIRNDLSK
jgi:hypothetical protein